jgi:hypothetical protein
MTNINGVLPQADPDQDDHLAPITGMISSRLIVLANLLKRGGLLRHERLAGLSSVEFGLVASPGRRPPMSVVRLAEAAGMDKGPISRARAGRVSASCLPERSTARTTGKCWFALRGPV